MNAHNNENDPFEDVFRDRFADFESEPDTQLWQKIEPKLPVDSTRKFPYWQISAVVILLLLAGLWTYREKYSDDVLTKSNKFQTKNLNLLTPLLSVSSQTTPKTNTRELSVETQTTTGVLKPELSVKTQTTTGSEGNQIKEKMLSDYRLTEPNPTKNTNSKDLIVNDLEKNTTKQLEEKADIPKLSNKRSVSTKNMGVTTAAETVIPTKEGTIKHAKNTIEEIKIGSQGNKSVEIITEEKSSIFSSPNTTIKTLTTSLTKTEENNFLNNDNKLNLHSINSSNEKQEINIGNSSNNSKVSNVFSNKENVSGLNKNYLTSLDSKSYSLLRNHFKTPKLKFVIAPKKDEYFKERKPLEIYASVMPLLNYYTITPNGNDANYVHSIAVNNDDDRLGFYTQAGVIFTLSDRFKLRTGFTFTRTNHSINYQIRTDSLIVQPSDKQGVDVSFEEKKANYSQVANYLGTKIEVQYIFLEGEALSHYLNVGLEGAYRLNGVKQFNGFANFAYGVTRQIGDNSYLFVEPTFSYSLNQQSDNNSFLLVKPNKIGFNIGVNFKIK
jgi:hypothetical protein